MVSKKIGVWIPHEGVWKEFTAFVEEKWGKKHTRMGMELEEAIKMYMASVKSGTSPEEELEKRVDEAFVILDELKKERKEFRQDLRELKSRVLC